MDKEELQRQLIKLTNRQCALEHYLETYMEPMKKELAQVNDDILKITHLLHENNGTDNRKSK